MASVYVASSLLNAENAKKVIARFREYGINITYDWTIHGQLFDENELMECMENEINGVLTADLFFMLFPARGGSHVELGLAIAYNILMRDKPIILVHEDDIILKPFYLYKNVFRFRSMDDAFKFAMEKLNVNIH